MKTWRCSFQSYLGLQKKQKGNKPNAININDNVLACIWSSRDIVQRKIPCPHWVYTLMGQTNKNMCQVVITSTKNKWSKENDWAYKWWSQTLNSGHENYVLPTFLFCFVILYQSQCYTKLPQSRPRKVIQICCSKLSHEEQGRKSYYRRYKGDRISGPQGVSRVGVFVSHGRELSVTSSQDKAEAVRGVSLQPLPWSLSVVETKTMALLPHKTCFRSPFIISYLKRPLRTRIWSVTKLGGAIYAQKTQILCFFRPSSSALGIWGPMNLKMSLKKKKDCKDFPKQMFLTFQWIIYEDKDRCDDLQGKKKNLTPPSVNLLA